MTPLPSSNEPSGLIDWGLFHVPPLSDEIATHRRLNTFSGETWFPEEPRTRARMTPAEVMEEAEHFLNFDVHPLQIAQTLHLKAPSIYSAATRLGNDRVSSAFARYSSASRLATAS